MVGDGVNDAAALQAAHVGIAMQDGSTASLVASDVFLTRSGIRGVADLLVGSRRVMSGVRRNLALSLVYNLIGAAAAMSGLVSPLVAAVAMPVSSLLVVTSSITQRSFGPQQESVPEPAAAGGGENPHGSAEVPLFFRKPEPPPLLTR
jgi:Cu2+-exporting ATPase